MSFSHKIGLTLFYLFWIVITGFVFIGFIIFMAVKFVWEMLVGIGDIFNKTEAFYGNPITKNGSS